MGDDRGEALRSIRGVAGAVCHRRPVSDLLRRGGRRAVRFADGRTAFRAVARLSSPRDARDSDRGSCGCGGDGLASLEVGIADARRPTRSGGRGRWRRPEGHGTSDRRCGRPGLAGRAPGRVRTAHRPRRAAGGRTARARRDGHRGRGQHVHRPRRRADRRLHAGCTRSLSALLLPSHRRDPPQTLGRPRRRGRVLVHARRRRAGRMASQRASGRAACDVRRGPPVDRAAVQGRCRARRRRGRSERPVLGKRSLAHLARCPVAAGCIDRGRGLAAGGRRVCRSARRVLGAAA